LERNRRPDVENTVLCCADEAINCREHSQRRTFGEHCPCPAADEHLHLVTTCPSASYNCTRLPDQSRQLLHRKTVGAVEAIELYAQHVCRPLSRPNRLVMVDRETAMLR